MPPPLDIGGCPPEEGRVIVERAQRRVVRGAGDPPEAGRAAALGRVTMTPGELVIVVDRDQGAQRLAADRAAPTLREDRGRDLALREPLTLGGRLSRVGDSQRALAALAEGRDTTQGHGDTHLAGGAVRNREPDGARWYPTGGWGSPRLRQGASVERRGVAS